MSCYSDEEVSAKLNYFLDNGSSLVREFRIGILSKNQLVKIITEWTGKDLTKYNVDWLLLAFSLLGEYDIVKLLWDKGARPTVLENFNCTVLHCAVRTHPQLEPRDADRAKMLKLFLSAKEVHGNSIPINHKNSYGWTALKLATKLQLEHCVEVLLEHGANPVVADDEDFAPLHNSVGNHNIIKMLLNASCANIDAKDTDGNTALLLSLGKGAVESSLTLLERGANPNIPNKEGTTPLFLATKLGQMEVVRSLIKHGGDVNAPVGEQRTTPLHWASFSEIEELAIFLIEIGGDVTMVDRDGRTPFSMASTKLQNKMKEAVQRCRPEIATSLDSFTTPPAMTLEKKAIDACCNGDIRVLSNLKRAGINVNYIHEETTASLLHTASYYGQIPAVAFLIQHGADIKAVDKDNDTILHFSCMKDFPRRFHHETLLFLLSCMQVDVNAQNRLGDTPLMLAIRFGFTSRVRMLLKFKARVDIFNLKGESPLHISCHNICSIEILFHMADIVTDFNPKDNLGLTPLMHAIKHKCSPATKYLLQKGADPNIQDLHGQTALFMAVKDNNFELCELLLMGQADPNIGETEKNRTPLHIGAQNMNRLILKILMEHGADTRVRDTDGHTPIDSVPHAHFREAFKVIIKARQEIKSELNARADKNSRIPSTSPTNCLTTPINRCPPSTYTGCDSLPTLQLYDENTPCNENPAECNTDPSNGLEVARSEEEEVLSGQTDMEEVEVEEGELSLESYQNLQKKLSGVRKALDEVTNALQVVTNDKDLLVTQNKAMIRDMHIKENLTVSRHMQHAVVLSMHAICHNLLNLDNVGMSHDSMDQSRDEVCSGVNERLSQINKMSPGSSTWSVASSSNATQKSHDSTNYTEMSPDMSHDMQLNGTKLYFEKRNTLSSSTSTDEEYQSGYGGAAVQHQAREDTLQPPNNNHLQWWMVSKTDYESSGVALNDSSDPSGRFFDVHRGTFRHMNVVVRTVRGVAKWSIDVYLSFLREVNFLSCLNCPWIVQFLCSCFEPITGTFTIINEYMDRGSLHSVLHNDKLALEWDTRLNIMWDVCRGMTFLHSYRLIHHSLNPRNILIGEHFNAKLNDFGLYQTKLKSKHYEQLSAGSHAHQAYMAPEALCKNDFTLATDVYSFGLVMFECGTSKKAFADQLHNPVVLGVQIMIGTRPKFPEDMALEYKVLAEQCWQQDPEQRPMFEAITATLGKIRTSEE